MVYLFLFRPNFEDFFPLRLRKKKKQPIKFSPARRKRGKEFEHLSHITCADAEVTY